MKEKRFQNRVPRKHAYAIDLVARTIRATVFERKNSNGFFLFDIEYFFQIQTFSFEYFK